MTRKNTNIIFLFLLFFIHIIESKGIKTWKSDKNLITKVDGNVTGGTTIDSNTFVSYMLTPEFRFITDGNSKIMTSDDIYPLSVYCNNFYILCLEESNFFHYYPNPSSINSTIYVGGEGSKIRLLSAIFYSNYFIVSIIGTNKVIVYEASDNFQQIYNHSEENCTLESMIQIKFNSQSCYCLLCKSNNETRLILYNYNGKLCFNYSSTDITLGEITEMSTPISKENNELLIFSFNKDTNEFYFYHCELLNDEIKLKSHGNKYTFLPFRNIVILKGIFLPKTELLYYLIQQNNKTYIGVLDIINQIIIYNKETTSSFVSFIDANKTLTFGEENGYYSVCPFQTINGSECITSFDNFDNIYVVINNIKGNEISNNCSNNKLGNFYCYDKCPYGYFNNPGNCSKCRDNNTYFDVDNNSCVNKCNATQVTDEKNKYCYSCGPFGEYSYLNKCVLNCPFSLVNENFSCINCLDQHMDEKPYYQNAECVKNCSAGYSSYNDTEVDTYICLSCNLTNRSEQNGYCVNECTNTTLNNTVNQCQECGERYFNNITKNCIDKCPDNTTNLNGTCNYCNPDQVVFENICNSNCPDLYQNISGVCINCTDSGNYIEDGKCVKNCSEGRRVNQNERKCEICEYALNTSSNDCTSDCGYDNSRLIIKPKNYSICYNCFCGYGECVTNESNNLYNYECSCYNKSKEISNKEKIRGKHCQFKYKDNITFYIDTSQQIFNSDEKNVFSFKIIEGDSISNNERTETTKFNYNRRRKYSINWSLNSQNSIKNENQQISRKYDTGNKGTFFVVSPEMFKDGENIISLKISDLRNNGIYEDNASIKIKKLNLDNFDFIFDFNDNVCNLTGQVKSKKNDEYFYYKIMFKTEDGEEFAITPFEKPNLNESINSDGDDNKTIYIPPFSQIFIIVKNIYNEKAKESYNKSCNLSDDFNIDLDETIKKYDNDKMRKNNSDIDVSFAKSIINELKTFFSLKKNEPLDLSTYNNTCLIIQDYLKHAIKSENSTDNDKKIEANHLTSLINQIQIYMYNSTINQYSYDYYFHPLIKLINDSVTNLTNLYKEQKEKGYISNETYLSYYRTIDNLYTIISKKLNDTEINDNIILDLNTLINCMSSLKNIYIKSLIEGEKINIKGHNFETYLVRVDQQFEQISIKESSSSPISKINDKLLDYREIHYNHGDSTDIDIKIEEKKKCDDNSIFCISGYDYDYLYDESIYLKNTSLTNLTFSVIKILNPSNFSQLNLKIKNKILQKFISLNSGNDKTNLTQISNYRYKIEIVDLINNTIINNFKTFRYTTTFHLPEKYIKDTNYLICAIINSEEFKHTENENCFTYFNKSSKRIICECNTAGEILVLQNKSLTDEYKYEFQYPETKLDYFNYLSVSIILSTLALLTIFPIILLLYDFLEDKYTSYISTLDKMNRAKYEYENFKSLKEVNIFKFAFYLTYFKYSYFNIFSTYKYDHPRHIRFYIQIIKVLLNVLLSMIPFYISENTFKDDIRVYPNEKRVFDFLLALLSICYSIIASIIIHFLAQILTKFLEYKYIHQLIWHPKIEAIHSYIYDTVKKNTMFKKKWLVMEKKIKAYYRICGNYILNNKNHVNNKFSKYIFYKNIQENGEGVNMKNENELSLFRDSNNIKIDCLNEELLPISKQIKNTKDKAINDNSIESEFLNNPKEYRIVKPFHSFTLSKIKNSLVKLSLETINKFEQIRNRYIYNIDRNFDDNFGEEDSKIIKYIDLDIHPQGNYTYISSAKISENKLSLSYNKEKINTTLLINIILVVVLILVDSGIIIVFKYKYESYEERFIYNWFIPVIFQISIINYILNYLNALFVSLILFKKWNKKKSNCFYRYISFLFIEKYMRYFYKIKILITKYYRDFELLK